jgi:phage-related protein
LDALGSPPLVVKDVVLIASSGDDLRDFPQVARQRAGYQLHLVASGQSPSGARSTSTVGPGCCQIRVEHSTDAHVLSYVAGTAESGYVLACSQTESPQGATSDLDLDKRHQQMEALIRHQGQCAARPRGTPACGTPWRRWAARPRR